MWNRHLNATRRAFELRTVASVVVTVVAGLDRDTFLIVYEETDPGDPSVHQRIYGRIFVSKQWVYLPLIKK